MFNDRPPIAEKDAAKKDELGYAGNERAGNERAGNERAGNEKAGDQINGAEPDEFSGPQPPSAVAINLKRLKSATFKAAQSRERLPHPLFWSLFLTEVSELRKKKEEKRLIDRILLGVGSE